MSYTSTKFWLPRSRTKSGAVWCAVNRLTSQACRSKEDTPSTRASAVARATPAEWVIHTASDTQKPCTSGDGPISGRLSVVKENSPLNPSSISASRMAGSSARVSFNAGAKSSGVKASIDGITSASAGEAMASGSTGMGRWP